MSEQKRKEEMTYISSEEDEYIRAQVAAIKRGEVAIEDTLMPWLREVPYVDTGSREHAVEGSDFGAALKAAAESGDVEREEELLRRHGELARRRHGI